MLWHVCQPLETPQGDKCAIIPSPPTHLWQAAKHEQERTPVHISGTIRARWFLGPPEGSGFLEPFPPARQGSSPSRGVRCRPRDRGAGVIYGVLAEIVTVWPPSMGAARPFV